jgi:hypothetical protein
MEVLHPHGTTKQLSGNFYVPMRLREESSETRPTPTKIASERRCEHEHTICMECADSWSLDWVIFWNRTAGGRRLYDRLLAAGKTRDLKI